METRELIEALSRPEAFPPPVTEVEVVQTHVSLVFLAGERAYKVKKAVDLGFVDFRTLEARRRTCEEEVRLNRRLAPGIYLGVAPIVEDGRGGLRVDAQGEPVEWAVEMVRLPAERMLDALLERGDVDNGMMGELAGILANFHAECPTGPGIDEHGAPDAVRANVLENFEQTRAFVAGPDVEVGSGDLVVSRRAHDFLRERALAFLDGETELLARRVREGRIRDGHGDLHGSNICFAPGGVVVYDCVEFAPRFRCGDVASDLAFLAMDLDLGGFSGFAGYLTRAYLQRSGDEEIERLLRFYKGYRAVVRAKVAALTAVDPALDPVDARARRDEAMRYFHLACAYELPPALVLTCGLPGTGKTWLARRLARPLHAVLLRSDVRRKILAGLPVDARAGEAYGQGLYGEEAKRRTYDSLLEKAVEAIRDGRSVVVDASFGRREERRRFVDAAARLGQPFFVVEVRASADVVRQRLARRAQEGRDASDADLAVYERAARAFEPPDEVPAGHLVRIDSDGPCAELCAARLIDLRIAAEAGAGQGSGLE